MGKITVTDNCNGIQGLKVIEPTVFGDARGYFVETYNYNDFAAAGIDCQFVQDNQSASKKLSFENLHEPDTDQKSPQRVSGASFEEPSRR